MVSLTIDFCFSYFINFFNLQGLEYVVEIQLVDSERRGSWYSCRLCERSFQSKDLVTNTTENIIHHLGLASHKLNYLVSFICKI